MVIGSYKNDLIYIEMGAPRNVTLNVEMGPWKVHSVDIGVPHAVVFVPDVDPVDVPRVAPILRNHSFFQPHGANVNFVHILSKERIRLRTYERGVEAETWACGTGAAAAAVIASVVCEMKEQIDVECTGGLLQVIPIIKNKFVFELRESVLKSSTVRLRKSMRINSIRIDLRSAISAALTQLKYEVIFDNWY